ncbi:MAG: hypothetical protein JSU70_08640, partial [Phycisphaerales bacterium]
MSQRRIKTIACLALLAGVLLITSIVWAKATKEPVAGTFGYAGDLSQAKIWIDDEGVTHLRHIPYSLWSTGGDLVVAESGVCNHNRNMATGDGDFWGEMTDVTVSWTKDGVTLTGTFRGRHSGITTSHMGDGTNNYQGTGGDFKGWKLRLDTTWDF